MHRTNQVVNAVLRETGWTMRTILRSLCALLLCASLCLAQTKAAQQSASTSQRSTAAEQAASPSAAKLPVRRVVLYKNGVGYFEHLGRVRGRQDVHIDFTSAQLNDVLKSLTVLDLSGGRITGVDYNSEAPLARRLATLRLTLGERPSVADFLKALRGARLEVRGGAAPAIVGRLLSVERKTRTGTNWTLETDEISLVTEAGEVRTVDLSPATIVRIAERDLQIEIGRYLGLIASARDQDLRRMTISTVGTGERSLYVGYVSEVPIWKTTYRIVLPSKPDRKPLLQGWAIVDNTVGQDWDNVELSLVAGAPHSFIQQLSQPFYIRRPIVPLPDSVQLSPQTHAATLIGGNARLAGEVRDQQGTAIPSATVRLLDENNNVIATTQTDESGEYEFESVATGSNFRVEVESPGFQKLAYSSVNLSPGENNLDARLKVGSVRETVTVEAAPATVSTQNTMVAGKSRTGVANRPHVGFGPGPIGALPLLEREEFREQFWLRRSTEAAASGQELGDLFEYKLKDRVTLRKNQSALVPIAQTEIEAEKVSLWGGASAAGRPLRALWVKNTSPLTLDGGSFSVLETETFAGEGLTDPIKPGERRILSYATDLGLLVEARGQTEPQRVTRVRIARGIMTHVNELHERKIYTVHSQDAEPRALIIEHPARNEWTLVAGAPNPEERAPGVYRFRVVVAPKATATLSVEEVKPLETSFQVSNLDSGQIAVFLKQGKINTEIEQALREIIAQKGVVAKLEEGMEARQKDIDRIVEDQERLRENLKALRGRAEEKALVQRYTQQLDRQETELEGLRKKIQDLEVRRDAENGRLARMIEDLAMEATL
jgi:hypothetical protein